VLFKALKLPRNVSTLLRYLNPKKGFTTVIYLGNFVTLDPWLCIISLGELLALPGNTGEGLPWRNTLAYLPRALNKFYDINTRVRKIMNFILQNFENYWFFSFFWLTERKKQWLYTLKLFTIVNNYFKLLSLPAHSAQVYLLSWLGAYP
jgi:hypothetical protein